MRLHEEINKIKNLIFELSPSSEIVTEFFELLEKYPELVQYLNFSSIEDLKEYIEDANYSDFKEIRKEAIDFVTRRKKYLESEMDEIERTAQELNRDYGINVSVDDIYTALDNAKEISLTDEIWKKLENTESNQIKRGELKKVIEIAKKYNKTNPLDLKTDLISGDYNRPLIIKINGGYYLVAGNTRLCTAAAIGVKPKVLVGELKK